LARLVGEEEGDLSAGASTTISQYLLPKLIGEFRITNPKIRLLLLGVNTEKIVRGVLDGTLAIGLIEGPSLHRDLGEEPFVADEIVVVVSSNHEWVGQQIEAQQLLKAPLILREKGSGTRRVVEAVLKGAGIQMKHAEVGMELDSTEAIKSAVEAGLGVGFVSRRAIQKEIKLDTLREVHITKLRFQRTFSIIYPRGPEPRGAAGVFLRFLREKRDQAPSQKCR
jgi:DNA-binding transcriptional LysR family regulator